MRFRTTSAVFLGSIHPVLLLLLLSCVNYYSAVTTAFWPSRLFSVLHTSNNAAPFDAGVCCYQFGIAAYGSGWRVRMMYQTYESVSSLTFGASRVFGLLGQTSA